MRRIWKNVVGFSMLLNHGHLVVWKGLEFLLLRRSFGNDYVEARGSERVFFALRVGAPIAKASSAMVVRILNEVRICFMVFRVLVLGFLGDREKLVSLHRGARQARRRSDPRAQPG